MRHIQRSILLLICLTVLFASSVEAQGNWQAEWLKLLLNPPKSTPELRQKTFEEVWKTIKDGHYDANYNGVDWNKVRKNYAPKIAQTQTDEELLVLLNQMIGELHLSHNRILSPKFILQGDTSSVADVGISLKIIDAAAIITKIEPNSSAEQAGLRQGFAITEIDGISTTQIAQEVAQKTVVPYLKEAEINSALMKQLRGEIGTKVEITYLDETDTVHKIGLERAKRQGEIRKGFGIAPIFTKFSAKRIDEKIGYISFNTFIGTKENIVGAIDSMLDASAIILDLRENGGGSVDVMNAVASMFFDKPTVFAKSKTRQGIKPDANGITKPVKNNFKGKLIILISSASASASETLAGGLQEIGRATIIGERSPGSLMEGQPKMLPNASILLYTPKAPVTPKGTIIEGRGVIPDIEIKLTRQLLLQGGDAQLEATIKFIRGN